MTNVRQQAVASTTAMGVDEAASTTTPAADAPSGGQCISVVARVRPDPFPSDCIELKEGQVDVAVPRTGEACSNHIEEYNFKFSKVLGPNTTQEDVFNLAVRDMVLGALEGVNCTVFAYGQTGSGKTHTICGGKGSYSERGIIPRALGCIFDTIDRRQDGVNFTVSMSFIEVYKEVGYDLLSKEFGQSAKNFPVVTVSIIGDEPVLQGAKRVPISSEDQGLEQYYLGDMHRTVAETPHNLNSSRSHCVFSIFIEASDPVAQKVRSSKVQIVDLAGSERLKPYEQGSQNSKSLMDQAVAINLSLHWLANVISALNAEGRRGVVPYRNSYLTKVLKDALGGNARAVMFATINPSDPALPETISTCRFAQHVANVQTHAKVNEELDPQLVIAQLRREKAELEAIIAASEGEGEELSDQELRRRVNAYLENEGGSTLDISSMRHAFVSFRIFRELHWELVRRRSDGTRSVTPSARSVDGSQAMLGNAVEAASASGEVPESTGGTLPVEGQQQGPSLSHPAAREGLEELRRLRRALEEREHECRMLRAATAAAQAAPRPAPVRVVRPRAVTVSISTQTEAPPKKVAKKKQERPQSAGHKPKGARAFIGFSPEDVVDRFGHGNSAVPAARVDPRIPDFRSRPQVQEAEEDAANDGSSSPTAPSSRESSPMPVAAAVPPSATMTQHAAVSAARDSDVGAGRGGKASASWLSATTALAIEERGMLGDEAKAYQIFLQHDPRAQDIWPSEVQKLRQQRKDRMEEARLVGEEIEQTREATNKVQVSLESLKVKLREADDAAAVDPAAEQRATTLRELLCSEEPKLVGLFEEKRARYELDCGRLKELRREVSHLEHQEKQLQAVVQTEFHQWRAAALERYPKADAPAEVANGCADPNRNVAPEEDAQNAEEESNHISPEALAAAESALTALRRRLEEARQGGDQQRVQMLEQLLAVEGPKMEQLLAQRGKQAPS